jgi:tetratricopeptide (TPR) repeat protein
LDLMDDLTPSTDAPGKEIGAKETGVSGGALTDWAALVARSPDDPTALLAVIQALFGAGRLSEARVLLDAAQVRFADHARFAIEAARAAQLQGETEEALRRWQIVRDRFPDAPEGLEAAATAQQQAGRSAESDPLPVEATPRPADDPAAAIDHAQLTHAKRDWPEALRRWAAVREQFPDQPQGYSGAAVAHRESGQFDLADALLQQALGRFPNVVSLAFEYGWVAHSRRDWAEAARRWETVRARAPDVLVGYISGAVALREAGCMAEAEALLLDAARRFPNDLRVVMEQAWLAQARRNWPEAVHRWDAVRAQLPDEEVSYTAGARALREQGRAFEADRLLRDAIARFPDSRPPLTEHAWLAHIGHNWPASVERWAAVRARFPDHAEAYVQAARALAELGRPDEADSLLAEGMARLPQSAEIAVAHANAALNRGDWAAAAERFRVVVERFPGSAEGSAGLARALAGRSNVAVAEPAAMPARAQTAVAEPAPKPEAEAVDWQVRDLALQFESLGGHQLGCEFGIFQRDCGAEPLGLLRWADMPIDGLVAALESRFEGVGSEDSTELFLSTTGDGRSEYCTRDRRGMMFMRTFIHEDEVPFDKMRASACRRLQLLSRKLVEDLEQGNKIFVYRRTDRDCTEAELDRLHAAMRAYGDNTLLYVRHEDAQHSNGAVELVKPGLMIGYIDRFKVSPTDEVSDALPTASWLQICLHAWDLWTTLRV